MNVDANEDGRVWCIEEAGEPVLLRFSGHDALRYLNGQVTQDVRQVGGVAGLPSCVTDAKGRLQFRVWLYAADGGGYWVAGPPGGLEELEQRLTRYLIADEVDVESFTGRYRLLHFLGGEPEVPVGVVARRVRRYGADGVDWWVPVDAGVGVPDGVRVLSADEVEDLRIRRGIPAWGRELTPGMLPPEAGLDETDISYHKGCYIGQEVISRVKFAGKTNRRLVRAVRSAGDAGEEGPWQDGEGRELDEITSVSPLVVDGQRHALGYQKRRK